MDRILSIPIRIETDRISHEHVITLDLQDVEFGELCLNLCLLQHKMVPALRVPGKRSLRVLVDNLEKSYRARVSIEPKQIQLQLTPYELDYWVSFFLKAYRDG